jgi:hypothetical protein
MPTRINLTASMLRTYKACPRLYELEYIEGLKPAKREEYFEMGSNYHSCVESILRNEPIVAEGVVFRMAEAFRKFIPWREWNVVEIENEFNVMLTPFCHMVGRIDAVAGDGTPIEHKTTSAAIDEKYIEKLAWDDQVNFYLLARTLVTEKPVTKVIYTVCQKPTIKLKQNETEEQYLARVAEWYTEDKVKALTVARSVNELKETEGEIREMTSQIRRQKHFYRNPANCRIMGCSYSSICLNYDPEIVTGFVKKERVNEELSCAF